MDTEGGSFQVFVKTLTGATVILWVTPDSSILSVKERLSDKLGWWMTRPGSLSLVFAGRELENEHLLSDYRIQEGNLLHQAPTGAAGAAGDMDEDVRMRGGKPYFFLIFVFSFFLLFSPNSPTSRLKKKSGS